MHRVLLAALALAGCTAAQSGILQQPASVTVPVTKLPEPVRATRSEPAPQACVPPSAEEVDVMRQELRGFLVIDRNANGFFARPPHSEELDDLAYFMVSVESAGAEVGKIHPDEKHGTQCPERTQQQVAALAGYLERLEKAREDGDTARISRAQKEYLSFLGYPGPIRVCDDGQFAWTGSWHSAIMRDLAANLEELGEHEDAELLYRRANPGGGRCGTGDGWRWEQQLQGAIRTGEKAHGCRRVVADRLLDASPELGTDALVTAGFDLERLYRGALLTRNRTIDKASLRTILSEAPRRFAGPALVRWKQRGAEAWDQRVWAIEGLADTERRPALQRLTILMPHLGDLERARALRAIGLLAERREAGPCRDGNGWAIWASGTVGGPWEREVDHLGSVCVGGLDDTEAAALSRQLAEWLADPAWSVRESAAIALGRVASDGSIPQLERLATSDPDVYGKIDKGAGWEPHFPVREAALEALQSIHEAYRWDEADDSNEIASP